MKGSISTTPFSIAHRFLGMRERPGAAHNAAIVAMLQLEDPAIRDDETPWCSAFVNYICWLLMLPRSNSLAARSWLRIGTPVALGEAVQGFHVVVLKRGGDAQPGPQVLDAPGHVGFYAGREEGDILVLGGNQGDAVSVARFPSQRVLGVREV